MFLKKTIRDIDLENKTVLLRTDYNVPLINDQIADDYRIKQSLETINYLLSKNCKIIIISHLGRPEGKANDKFSLFPVAKSLGQILSKDVQFGLDCIGPKTDQLKANLKPREILLLENLRFHPEEENNDPEFGKALASYADVFVQDGFGVVHRAHASTSAVTKFLPSVAGLLLEKEVDTITNVMKNPDRPLCAVIGGAKIVDKIEIIERFIESADFLVLGGAMSNTFLSAQGHHIGESLYDKDELKLAKDLIQKAEEQKKKRNFIFLIPFDGVVSKDPKENIPTRIVDWSTYAIADIENYPKKPPKEDFKIKKDEKILDIGPFSGAFIAGGVQLSKTVVWNGTLGVTEIKGYHNQVGPYAHGTDLLIQAILGDFGNKPFSLVGGGDTVGYIRERGLSDGFNHLSTGGGASLELMAGHQLPGVEALLNKD